MAAPKKAQKVANLKAHGGGVSIKSSNNPKASNRVGNVGKVKGASQAGLPSQKNKSGSGIAGRGTARGL